MEIIATTNKGVLIQASNQEVDEILNAVNGVKPEKLKIGMKIPAIDYASTIRKIQTLQDDYNFKELIKEFDRFGNSLNSLVASVINASKITTD